MELFDVTLQMSSATVHWPGHPHYLANDLLTIAAGDGMNVSEISMCSHFGTHIDAPSHYVPEGLTVDKIPLDLLVGPCVVVEYDGTDHIGEAAVADFGIEGVRRLLIRTRNSATVASPEFREDYIGLTPAGAQRVLDCGVELLGVDGYSIGPWNSKDRDLVHRIFLGGGERQAAIEGLDLHAVSPGTYNLIALPLRVTGLEAAPTRVVLQRDDVDQRKM